MIDQRNKIMGVGFEKAQIFDLGCGGISCLMKFEGVENTAMAIFRQILALNRNLCDAHHRYPLIDHQRSTMC